MKTDEQPSKDGSKLTPEETINELIAGRVAELIVDGDSTRAREILMAYQKSSLPDNHPIKSLESFQILEQDQVSLLKSFERNAEYLSAGVDMLIAINAGGVNMDNMMNTTMLFASFFRDKYPELLQEVADYLTKNKAGRHSKE